jgi:hypothetical protein
MLIVACSLFGSTRALRVLALKTALLSKRIERAFNVIMPAVPVPRLSTIILAPSRTSKVLVFIVKFPASPEFSEPVTKALEYTPSAVIPI